MDDLIHRLRSFTQAYPEDIFPPLTELDLKYHSAIISRASAAMGRHFGKVLTEIADELEKRVHGAGEP